MVLKLFKDTFLIASALALVLFLLFLSSSFSEFVAPKPTDLITGNAVAESPMKATSGLQIFFFIGIIILIYLIHKAWKLPGPYRALPKPSYISAPKPSRLVVPKPIQPIFREVEKPVKEVYKEIRKVERDIEKELHDELDYIRKLVGEGKHELAKKHYKGIKR